MKNKAFQEAFGQVRLSGEARERILDAALETPPARRTAGVRPTRIALAAALAVCLLTGTALAVSPKLRDLLWGDFEPVVQTFEPNEENTQVYDGVEARLVSAMTDGLILKVHVEFRDLTGADRLRRFASPDQTEEAMPVPSVLELLGGSEAPKFTGDTPGGVEGLFYTTGNSRFDEATGILTMEFTMNGFTSPENPERVCVSIFSGALGTQALLDGKPADVTHEGPFNDVGWFLTAPLQALPARQARSGDLRAVLSDIGLTLTGDGAGDAATLAFSDGTTLDCAYGISSGFPDPDGTVRMTERSVIFPAPIDADAVESVTVGRTVLTFD